MRSVALGRKNYLFVGSQTGGKSAAIAHTLIETAKLNGVDPQACLADTLARIPDHKINHIDELLPWSAITAVTPSLTVFSTSWIDSNFWNSLFLAAMILSGSAVQEKGLASDVLWCVRKFAIAVSRSWPDRNTPCFSRRLVSLAKMRRIRKRSGFEQGPIDPGDQLACEWFS